MNAEVTVAKEHADVLWLYDASIILFPCHSLGDPSEKERGVNAGISEVPTRGFSRIKKASISVSVASKSCETARPTC